MITPGVAIRGIGKGITRHSLITIFAIPGLLILLFILVPLIKMVFLSDKEALAQSIIDPSTLHSIGITLGCGLLAAAVGFLLGVPLAYILARYRFTGKNIIEGLIDLPIVVPHSAAGIALLFVFGNNFMVGQFFGKLGIFFVDTIAGIVIAMLFVSVPFLINSAKEGFRKVDIRLEYAARSLGASPGRSLPSYFCHVIWSPSRMRGAWYQ